ncbi:hypothetical protein G3O00_01480 [Burkholderia sp. Ac-20384]|uniref:hypothetical protein n=1 Tax=Burkholderia sp. Ac-20384 TaxID=2703902 RepID=UPI0019812D3F|nr:hypothetical protein [Burkholderia sp. Ac-20384]MBN3822289.1 hypothetical protein [Burkholderia sp. Ac-20384]
MAGTKKKPRSKYDPRRALSAAERLDARAHGRRRLLDSQLRDMGIAYRIAFDRMRSGRGDASTWSTLNGMMHIAAAMAERGIGYEHTDELDRALAGIERAERHGRESGCWTFDGDALSAVCDALIIHDAQLEVATIGDAREAIEEAERRIDQEMGARPANDSAAAQRMAA